MTITILILELVIMIAALVAMTVGVVTIARKTVTQLRQELRVPASPYDAQLAAAAQQQVEALARSRGLRAPRVTVVPIFGRTQRGARAGMVGSGGLGVTRTTPRGRGQATILLAAAAGQLRPAAREVLLAHELAHIEHYTSRRAVLVRYGWIVAWAALVLGVVWAGLALSTSAALLLGGLLVGLFLTVFTFASRREELAADLYAIDLTGNLEAAAELVDVYIQARDAGPRRGWLHTFVEDRLWATHPEPEARLAAMRRRMQQP